MVDLLIRVDATKEMGHGHFMRCFALVMRCLELNMSVQFVCHTLTESCKQKLAMHGLKVHFLKSRIASTEEALETLVIAQACEAKILLFDGYHFSEEYFEHFKNKSFSLCMIDDFANVPPYFDLIINYQPWAVAKNYTAHSKAFLGLEYFLLRSEFQTCSSETEIQREHILLSMGGTDPHQQTMRILNILRQQHFSVPICIILGEQIPDLEEYIHQSANKDQHISIYINPPNMPLLMAKAIFAITAGGGTCWELAFMGTPMITLPQADNQLPVAEQVANQKVGINLGAFNEVTDQQIADAIASLLANENLRSQMQRAALKLNIGAKIQQMIDYMKGRCQK